MSDLIHLRRVPTYQFIVRTSRPVPDVVSHLEFLLSAEPAPQALRFNGTLSNRLFTFRERRSFLERRPPTVLSGQLLPGESGGTNIIGSVRYLVWVPVAWLGLAALTLAGALFSAEPTLTRVALLLGAVVIGTGTFFTQWAEGTRLARALRDSIDSSTQRGSNNDGTGRT